MASIASEELGDLLGRNNAGDIDLKKLKHRCKKRREHPAMRSCALAHMQTNFVSCGLQKCLRQGLFLQYLLYLPEFSARNEQN